MCASSCQPAGPALVRRACRVASSGFCRPVRALSQQWSVDKHSQTSWLFPAHGGTSWRRPNHLQMPRAGAHEVCTSQAFDACRRVSVALEVWSTSCSDRGAIAVQIRACSARLSHRTSRIRVFGALPGAPLASRSCRMGCTALLAAFFSRYGRARFRATDAHAFALRTRTLLRLFFVGVVGGAMAHTPRAAVGRRAQPGRRGAEAADF